MKGGNRLVAGAVFGVAVAPYCADHFRPHSLLFDPSLEQWFVSALRGGDASKVLILAALLCALAGILAGLLLAKAIQGADGSWKGELSLLRTPLAAAVLIPLGIATLLALACNHTPRVLDRLEWPPFYANHAVAISLVAAVFGLIVAEFLNGCERVFQGSPALIKLGITCCLPLAVAVGVASMAGLLGSGLLGGAIVGRLFGCPVTGAWTGGCLSIAILVVQNRIFWPAYFPSAGQGGK